MIHLIIPQIDKLKHAYLWTLFFLVLSISLSLSIGFFYCKDVAIIVSLILTHITAAVKEIKDYFSEDGKAELLDYIYSVLFPTLFVILYFLKL